MSSRTPRARDCRIPLRVYGSSFAYNSSTSDTHADARFDCRQESARYAWLPLVTAGLASSAPVHTITMAAMLTGNPHRLGLPCIAIVGTLTHSRLASHPDTRNRFTNAHSWLGQVL